MRLTKKQMVKDIFFLATDGERTRDNFVQGMGIIDAVSNYNYRDSIKDAWDKVCEAGTKESAKRAMLTLTSLTYFNLPQSHRHWFRMDRIKFNF